MFQSSFTQTLCGTRFKFHLLKLKTKLTFVTVWKKKKISRKTIIAHHLTLQGHGRIFQRVVFIMNSCDKDITLKRILSQRHTIYALTLSLQRQLIESLIVLKCYVLLCASWCIDWLLVVRECKRPEQCYYGKSRCDVVMCELTFIVTLSHSNLKATIIFTTNTTVK